MTSPAPDPTTSGPERYTIQGGEEGKRRLNALAEVMSPYTCALLDAVALPAGARCLDVGCGGGHVALELARRAGPAGRVLGLDRDEVILALAREDAEAAGVANVEYRLGDAHAVRGTYDLAYARFLLSHVQDPAGVVAGMAATVTPGGAVVVEDIDFQGAFCQPANRAYQRYLELYRETVRRRGGNADIGPLLPSFLRAAGLRAIGVRVVQPVALDGDGKRVSHLTLERIAAAAVAEGVAGEAEVAEVSAGLLAFTNDPTTLISFPRIVQAWGRVP
jgi:predicted O-methyltransferase YrrM